MAPKKKKKVADVKFKPCAQCGRAGETHPESWRCRYCALCAGCCNCSPALNALWLKAMGYELVDMGSRPGNTTGESHVIEQIS